ncbi:DeoR/GlpR family DNA-binding transcription regulator [Inquilinus sp. Marseille-Q2685]|uniref:DeoR/GlpR family DNA-binding transcription regulator n=1 Tax=Inquilinus sp. Marseille-Q2685 TaxID=2866581 RepID=UPI001CE43F34|nr:DeoR/GlpR family DNA-binding transcription regulator [Inquilinus sp. Marseille-Q2685]
MSKRGNAAGPMLSNRWQGEILHAVRESGSCSIADLARRFAVSTETTRRSVKPLIETGAVVRFQGGVMLRAGLEEPPFQRRMQRNREAKQAVAALVAARIADGDPIILDNGTTSAYVAQALAHHSRLVVVTNSAEIACRLAPRNDNRVFLCGGEVNGDDVAAFGPSAIAFVRQFQVRCAVLSVGGINGRGELVDFHLFEAEFSHAAMAQAAETWVIADHSKFGREAPVKVCSLADVDLVLTDRPPPPDFARRCDAAGVRIAVPEGGS